MDQCSELGSLTSEAQAWHLAGAPRPCQPHGLRSIFLLFGLGHLSTHRSQLIDKVPLGDGSPHQVGCTWESAYGGKLWPQAPLSVALGRSHFSPLLPPPLIHFADSAEGKCLHQTLESQSGIQQLLTSGQLPKLRQLDSLWDRWTEIWVSVRQRVNHVFLKSHSTFLK